MNDLKRFIRELNEAWQDHRYDDLYGYFHENVAMLPPGSTQPIVGNEPMIQSYRQFVSMARIHAFRISDIELYNFGATTVCHMQFDVDYEIESGRFQEKGMEIYVIDSSGNTPRVVWRTQIVQGKGDA